MKTFLLIPLLFAVLSQAQAPANATLIGPEGITITASSASNTTFMFGVGTKFNTVANPKYPLVVNCGSGFATACALLGGDPAQGVAKSIYAVQQAQTYTVTVNGKPITVPALPPPPIKPVKTWSCAANTAVVFSLMSDGTFQVSGPIACKETL